MPKSMLNKWDYKGVSDICYSDPYNKYSYTKPAEFLGNGQVEDWGGGTGWARRYFTDYKNIDGSPHENVDVVVDLYKYTSDCDNILIRQVLEYNWEWETILQNAKKSFRKKLCIVIMTPLVGTTKIDSITPVVNRFGESLTANDTPNVFFSRSDILKYFPEGEYKTSEEIHKTKDSLWGEEWILYVEKINS